MSEILFDPELHTVIAKGMRREVTERGTATYGFAVRLVNGLWVRYMRQKFRHSIDDDYSVTIEVARKGRGDEVSLETAQAWVAALGAPDGTAVESHGQGMHLTYFAQWDEPVLTVKGPE